MTPQEQFTSGEGVDDFTHNGWLIEHRHDDKFDCTHPDFEGPYDERCILANSPDEAIRLIDEWVDEEPHGVDEDAFWRDSPYAERWGMGD